MLLVHHKASVSQNSLDRSTAVTGEPFERTCPKRWREINRVMPTRGGKRLVIVTCATCCDVVQTRNAAVVQHVQALDQLTEVALRFNIINEQQCGRIRG